MAKKYFVFILLFISLDLIHAKEDVTIIYKSKNNPGELLSCFNDFTIENNQVNIRCKISFMNNTDAMKKIMIMGFF